MLLLELSADGTKDILLLFKPVVDPSLEAAAAEAVWLLLRCMPPASTATRFVGMRIHTTVGIRQMKNFDMYFHSK